MSDTLLPMVPTPVSGATGPASMPSDSLRGPVLLALSGTPSTRTPTMMAAAIAARIDRPLRVVTAQEPALEYAGAFSPLPMPSLLAAELLKAREDGVRRHLHETLKPDQPFTLDVRYGMPSFEVANAALDADATLLVLGAAPHQTRRGIVSGRRATTVLRNVRCPTLSVAPSKAGLPMQGIVAVDFSPASLRAARDALMVIGDGGTLTLLHVALPLQVNQPVHLSSGAVYRRDALERLVALRDHMALAAPPGVTIVTREAAGDATEEILAAIDALSADLVVVGTHGPGLFERTVVGSLAADVLRLAPCSVLASPRPGPAARLEFEADEWGTGVTADPAAWPEVLDAFTRRNAGRRVRIEVDDSTYGAQVQASGLSLDGATYDPHDQRVELMLSARDGASRLTRGVSGVDRVAIARDHHGRDAALQLRHDDGETLVIFLGG